MTTGGRESIRIGCAFADSTKRHRQKATLCSVQREQNGKVNLLLVVMVVTLSRGVVGKWMGIGRGLA